MNTRKIYPQWFLIAPILLYLLFFLLPGLLGVLFAFTDWNVRSLDGVHFVGLQNFIDIFSGGSVRYSQGIANTLWFTVVSNIVKLVPALFLAILLSGETAGPERLPDGLVHALTSCPFSSSGWCSAPS